MATFSGTTQKSTGVYHKACFRCHHWDAAQVVDYSSLEHSFVTIASRYEWFLEKENEHPDLEILLRNPREVACKKTAYPIEKVAVDRTPYHKSCFRCSHSGCLISPSNYITHEHRHYCKAPP